MHPLIDPKKSPLVSIARGIAKTFGSRCEVVLHNLKNPESSLVFIEGNVTNRSVGSPATNLVLRLLKKYGDDAPDVIGYESRTRDGRRLKSSTIFIRDQKSKKIVGCLCINLDLSEWDIFHTALHDFMDFSTPTNSKDETFETFPNNVSEVLNLLVEEVIKNYGKSPKLMSKEDRLKIIKKLETKGVFMIKGSIDYVATLMGISRQSIYSYLDEIKKQNNDNIF